MNLAVFTLSTFRLYSLDMYCLISGFDRFQSHLKVRMFSLTYLPGRCKTMSRSTNFLVGPTTGAFLFWGAFIRSEYYCESKGFQKELFLQSYTLEDLSGVFGDEGHFLTLIINSIIIDLISIRGKLRSSINFNLVRSKILTQKRMDEQSLRSNAVTEDFFKIGVKCINLCQTEFVEDLSPQQKLCLETCGYNRAYLIHNFKTLVEKAVNLQQ